MTTTTRGTRGRVRTPGRRSRTVGTTTGSSGVVESGGSASTRSAAQRAYARRDRRARLGAGGGMLNGNLTGGLTGGLTMGAAISRASFVVVLIAALGCGIAGVLWLTTMTDEAGLRTSRSHAESNELRLDIEALRKDVAVLDGTPRIAQAAAGLGMVPAGDAAMLVLDGSGAGSVVGTPTPVPAPVAPVVIAEVPPAVTPTTAPPATTPATTPAEAVAAAPAPTSPAAEPAPATEPAPAAVATSPEAASSTAASSAAAPPAAGSLQNGTGSIQGRGAADPGTGGSIGAADPATDPAATPPAATDPAAATVVEGTQP